MLKLLAAGPKYEEDDEAPDGFIKKCGEMQVDAVRTGNAGRADRFVKIMRSFNANRDVYKRQV